MVISDDVWLYQMMCGYIRWYVVISDDVWLYQMMCGYIR